MKRVPFIWIDLFIPAPISREAAWAAIAALAGLSGQPRLVLEASGRDGQVSWKLGARATDVPRTVRALESHLPDLRSERRASTFDGLRADTAAAVRVRAEDQTSFNPDAVEPATRGVLGVLASTRRAELLHVQLILGPRRRPSRPPGKRPAATAVGREHRFACEVRVGASTADPARSRSLINGVIGALRALEAPGLHFNVGRASSSGFSAAKSPLIWSSSLSVSDIVPLTGWPVAASSTALLPGVPSPHPRLLSPTSSVARSGRVLGLSAVGAAEIPIAVSVDDSLRHLHVLGPTGVGKSTLLASLALQDIAAGRSTVMIDPKGDLVSDVLARLDQKRVRDVVVLDASDQMPIGINPLTNPTDPDLVADTLLALFRSLYGDGWLPRTHELLQASLLSLARRGDASIAMLPLLLGSPGFRRSVVGKASKADPLGVGAFWAGFEAASEAERQQASAPLLRRLRPILMRPNLRAIFGQRRPKFSLDEVFTGRKTLLVSLSKGVIGPEAADLLGSIVVSQLWSSALARASVDRAKRRPVMVYIDEVQDYLRLPGDLGDALAQARGLGVGYTLAHQHLDQLGSAMRRAVLANARSRVAFQLPHADARDIAATTRGQLVADDFESLPAFSAYGSLLHGNQTGPWVSLKTEPLPEPVRNADLIRDASRRRYGQPLDQVEADLLNLVAPPASSRETFGRSPRRSPDQSDGSTS